MKSLSLYVDKWFITVAINFDGNVIPLSLPNGEDRIGLLKIITATSCRIISEIYSIL